MSPDNFPGNAGVARRSSRGRRGFGAGDTTTMRRLLPILAAAAPARRVRRRARRRGARRSRPRTGSRRARSWSSSRASSAGARWPCPPAPGCARRRRPCASNPRVAYAEPDYIATASATEPPGFALPNDPGTLDGASEAAASAGDWAFKQWNFLPSEGDRDGAAADLARAASTRSAPGATWPKSAAPGPTASPSPCSTPASPTATRAASSCRSPDFAAGQFVKGYDFIDDDRLPLDENGHGTHVAGTIAEKTDNGVALTGLAYRAKLMPVRVLDKHGRGQASDIAKGIRFAVAHRAQVINMSFNFGCGKQVPEVDEALREAYARGVVTVASAGNLGSETCVSEPATGPRVIGVGGTTEGGCLGNYSLAGKGIDLVAPGGGTPSAGCPSVSARPIYQVTLKAGLDPDLRDPLQLRRHLDGRGPRQRRRGDGAGRRHLRRPALHPGNGPGRQTPRQRRRQTPARNRPRPGPAEGPAGRRPDRRRPATEPTAPRADPRRLRSF